MNYSPDSTSEIAINALEAWLDAEHYRQIEEERPLTRQERNQQIKATIRLLIFGPTLFGLTLDRFFGSR